MKERRLRYASSLIGVLLILAGILVPSTALIESLRATSEHISDQLLLGATLFRISLVALGAVCILMVGMPVWTPVTEKRETRAAVRIDANVIIMLLVLLAALALRLYRLNSGIWLDEILTYVEYARMPFGQNITTFGSENQHFLYSLLAHSSFNIFGESTAALRLPAVLFGVASIWALYLFGRAVTDGREALLSAALLAFSYHHVWFSQNARGYSGLLFWTLLSSWLLVKALRDRHPRFWLLYAASAALGTYTHLTMGFVIIGHFITYLIALVTQRRDSRQVGWSGFLLGFCVAGLLILLLHSLVLPQMLNTVGGTEQSVVSEWKNPIWTLLEIVKGLQIGFVGGIVGFAAFVLFGAGAISYLRTEPIVIQLLIIAPILGAATVIAIGHHLWPRFFFFAMGFGVLVVIRGVMVFGRLAAKLLNVPSDRSAWVGTALCVGLILVSSASVPFAYSPKQDYERARDFVESEKAPGDSIVTVGLASFVYHDFYQMDWREAESLEALNAIRQGAERTWLVYTFPPVLQSVYPEIMASIQQDFEILRRFPGSVGSGTIIVSRSDGAPTQISTEGSGSQ